MVARSDVVLVEVGDVQGTGFLIAPGKLVTALHVVAELDGHDVVRDERGHFVPLGPVTCTFFTTERGFWHEPVELDPRACLHSVAEDWVVLELEPERSAGARIWSCDSARADDRHQTCAAYGFPQLLGTEGAPYHGTLTGIHDPWEFPSASSGLRCALQIHRAWFAESVSTTGLSPQGFSGAPVVVGDRVVGVIRSFIAATGPGAGDSLVPVGGTVLVTPIEAVLIAANIDAISASARVVEREVAEPAGNIHTDVRGSDLLVDNWLLQSVAGLLTNGLDHDRANVIDIDRDGETHRVRDVPAGGVEIECLIALINDIVLRERLVLDEEFKDTWRGTSSRLDSLVNLGLLRLVEIDRSTDIFRHAKGRAVGHLCATKSLVDINRENRDSIIAGGDAAHPLFSQLLAGTAGNFGRSAVTRIAYSPHPLRGHLVSQTIFRDPTAVDRVVRWLDSERAQVVSHEAAGGDFRSSRIRLPPIVVQVIEDSSSLDDLIPTALQYREKYAAVRGWLRAFQDAVDDEDTRSVQKREDVLKSVSHHLATQRGPLEYGETRLSISIGIFTAFNRLRQRFGIRASLNDLVMTSAGDNSLNKLLRMLDAHQTSTGYRIREYLLSRHRER